MAKDADVLGEDVPREAAEDSEGGGTRNDVVSLRQVDEEGGRRTVRTQRPDPVSSCT